MNRNGILRFKRLPNPPYRLRTISIQDKRNSFLNNYVLNHCFNEALNLQSGDNGPLIHKMWRLMQCSDSGFFLNQDQLKKILLCIQVFYDKWEYRKVLSHGHDASNERELDKMLKEDGTFRYDEKLDDDQYFNQTIVQKFHHQHPSLLPIYPHQQQPPLTFKLPRISGGCLDILDIILVHNKMQQKLCKNSWTADNCNIMKCEILMAWNDPHFGGEQQMGLLGVGATIFYIQTLKECVYSKTASKTIEKLLGNEWPDDRKHYEELAEHNKIPINWHQYLSDFMNQNRNLFRCSFQELVNEDPRYFTTMNIKKFLHFIRNLMHHPEMMVNYNQGDGGIFLGVYLVLKIFPFLPRFAGIVRDIILRIIDDDLNCGRCKIPKKEQQRIGEKILALDTDATGIYWLFELIWRQETMYHDLFMRGIQTLPYQQFRKEKKTKYYTLSDCVKN